LQASQLVTVKCDVAVGFDLIAAENVSSADWSLIAGCDQRLSEARNRCGRRRCFRFHFRQGGFEARSSRFRWTRLRAAFAHGHDGRRLGSFGLVDIMQVNALPSCGAEQFHRD
jgi:hypothetical protein